MVYAGSVQSLGCGDTETLVDALMRLGFEILATTGSRTILGRDDEYVSVDHRRGRYRAVLRGAERLSEIIEECWRRR